MTKIQSSLYYIFLILFIPVMAVISFVLLDSISEIKYITYPLCFTTIILGSFFVLKKYSNKVNNIVFYIAVAILAVFLFSMQIYLFKGNPELILYGDIRAMYSGFREISSYGELTGYSEYFLAHPHQLFTALFYGVLNRIFAILGFQAPVSIVGTILTNCILVTSGGVLLSFSIKKITNEVYGILTMFLFCLFNSYWGCVFYAYTHTLSVFFVCTMIFCFSSFSKCNNDKSKILWLAISGAAFALCKSSEGITLIAFVAAIIYIVITCEKIKALILHLCVLILSFIVTLLIISGIYNVLGIVDFSQQDRYEFPLTHWIMMGLGETGEYCEEDYQNTVNLDSKQEKFEMHKDKIAERLASRSPIEMVKFLIKKQHVAWFGGTYGASPDFPDKFAYNFAYRLFLVLSIIAGAIYCIYDKIKNKNNNVKFLAFSQIYIIGIILFFCIWEVSYAYLFSSIPMLIICAVLSLNTIFEKQ